MRGTVSLCTSVWKKHYLCDDCWSGLLCDHHYIRLLLLSRSSLWRRIPLSGGRVSLARRVRLARRVTCGGEQGDTNCKARVRGGTIEMRKHSINHWVLSMYVWLERLLSLCTKLSDTGSRQLTEWHLEHAIGFSHLLSWSVQFTSVQCTLIFDTRHNLCHLLPNQLHDFEKA